MEVALRARGAGLERMCEAIEVVDSTLKRQFYAVFILNLSSNLQKRGSP